ncbi:ATP-binding cassette domain-containing protein [Lysobacter pythonis]|uniref:ATP-binding cassette domain-containing protein n=1 Tax=Solilutibacter pythonis TaxID=2483112 RepID=A0A3M2HZQ3_9GAMM|nr:ATP-binding cassette domain-containing protein [Lysobacter pythonis]RMH93595.1 ATP-binding cassette domain-containing protein [Lysobacter pythonis]
MGEIHSGLRLAGLTKTYANGVHALQGVSLDVRPGLFGLLGPNGAGKSTLMRTLAGLQRPDEGGIHLDGHDVLADPHYLRQRLGYLPQQIGAYPGVNAWTLLERFAWLKGRAQRAERRQEVTQLLERVNLLDAADRPVATYSGGMLRRFGIAIALLGRPRLLIVDEPTAGLDPAERNRFHRVLAEVADDAMVLLSTHIVEDVEHLCQHVAILAGGRIVAEGAPAELVRPLAGRLWSRIVPRGEALPEREVQLVAVATGTLAVIEAASPPPGYVPFPPRLEEAYHLALKAAGAEERSA